MVYNLTVLGSHTYTAEGFAVHNCFACMGLDGKTWALNDNHVRPPLHVACRCTIIPVLKPWNELGLPMKDIPEGMRPSLSGDVPASTTYEAWLKTQPAEVVDEALGPARGAMFRAGTVSVGDFTNRQGRTLTLAQLRRTEGR